MASADSKSPVTSDTVDLKADAKLAKLMEMGFEVEESQTALQQCEGDVEAACELLAASTQPSASPASSSGGFLASVARYCTYCICSVPIVCMHIFICTVYIQHSMAHVEHAIHSFSLHWTHECVCKYIICVCEWSCLGGCEVLLIIHR